MSTHLNTHLNTHYAGDTVLLNSIWSHQATAAKYMVSKGADITVKDKFGNSCLIAAAAEGQIETVRLLIALGINIEEVN